MTKKSYTLTELATLTGAKLIGNGAHIIVNVADLESAGPEDASFLNKLPFGQQSRYGQLVQKSSAGVIFIHPEVPLIEGRNFLLHEDPSRAFQIALEALHFSTEEWTGFAGIHPSAIIHPSVQLGSDVHVGPLAVIDKDVTIGTGTHIGAGVVIGPGVVVGEGCFFHPRAVIRERCVIGKRVILQPGAVIGSCGFGYTTTKEGTHQKLNQVGIVVIEDDVEIGANTAIDRSRFKETRICRGTKIDNLVQIGHGAKIGPDNIIVSLSGVAGSAETGRHVVLAGQCGVVGHIKLADGVILSARSGVDRSLPTGRYGGAPVQPLAEHHRTTIHLRNLEKYIQQLKALEARLTQLEEK